MADLPQLPPGFVLDQMPQAQPQLPQQPAPPPGFTPDEMYAGDPKALPPFGPVDAVDDPGSSANFLTTLRATMAPNTDDQIKRFAAARFPGMPLEEATKLYGVMDGNVVYFDPAKKTYVREVPSVDSGGLLEKPARAAHWLAGNVWPAAPQVAGSIAAVASPGPFKGPAVAAGVAGAVDLLRQTADRLMAGESVSDVDLSNVLGQAGLAGAGEVGGRLIAKGARALFDKNPLDVGVQDFGEAMDPSTRAAAARIMAEARKRGLFVTPGEATDLPSLLGNERYYRATPEGGALAKAIQLRNEKAVPEAIRKELGPIVGTDTAVRGLRHSSEAVMEALRLLRKKAADPLYDEAYKAGPVWSDRIQEFLDDPIFKGGLKRGLEIQRLEALANRKPFNPKDYAITGFDEAGDPILEGVPNMRLLAAGKRGLDAILDEYRDKQTHKLVLDDRGRAVDMVRKAYADELHGLNEDYRTADTSWATDTIPIERAKNSPIGDTAGQIDPVQPKDLDLFFSASRLTPEEAVYIRRAYQANGQLPAYEDARNAWLEQQLLAAMKPTAEGSLGNVPGKFAKVLNDPRQRAVLEATFKGDATRLDSLRGLLDVLEAAGRSKAEGAPTSANLMRHERMRQRIGLAWRALFGVVSPQNIGTATGSYAGEQAVGAQLRKVIAATMNSTDLDALANLRQMGPKSDKAIQAATKILVNAGWFNSDILKPADRPVTPDAMRRALASFAGAGTQGPR